MKPSNVITLPAWMSKKPRKYIPASEHRLSPSDIALRFALSIKFHDSAEELRRLARRMSTQVCLESQSNMNRLSRTMDDDKVFEAVLNIINRVCDTLGYAPGEVFRRPSQEVAA